MPHDNESSQLRTVQDLPMNSRPQAYDTLAVLRALRFMGGGGGGGGFFARDGGGGGACLLPFGPAPFNVE